MLAFLLYLPPFIFSVAIAVVCDSSICIQVKSFGSYSKGAATVCYCYMEEVPYHEVSFECIHGP
jgi:hypothetical protein